MANDSISPEMPAGKTLSLQEKEKVKENFLHLLHKFLFFYLSIHNAIIPIIQNILKDRNLLIDVHFLFLFQLFFIWSFLNNRKWFSELLVIGFVLSFFNIIFESLPFLGGGEKLTWSSVSIYLSETACLIFYFCCFKFFEKAKWSVVILGVLFSLLTAFGLNKIEKRSFNTISYAASGVTRNVLKVQYGGCHGSQIIVSSENFYNKDFVTVNDECGFEHNAFVLNKVFNINNKRSGPIHLRLYKLELLSGAWRWVYKKIFIISEGKDYQIVPLQLEKAVFLLKSAENPDLGVLLLSNLPFEEAPKLKFDGDSIIQ